MASFETRGDSTRVVVRLPGGGKKTGTFDTLAEAQAWGSEQERKKKLGTIKIPGGVTVGEMLEAYEEAVASKTDSAKWNKLRIRKWLLDPLAQLRLSDIVTHDINQWIDRRLKEVSPATVNREMNLMGGAFTYAVKDRKWVVTNPCHGARRPERGRPRKRPLMSPDEIAAICIATGYDADPDLRTKTARVGACFLLALETGMRSGEILRIKPAHYWRDRLTVRVAAEEKGGRKASRSGRASVDPSRSVPLTGRAVELLDQLLATMPADQPYIVGLSDEQRDALWRKARNQACVVDLTFHDTKHEAATRLAPFLDVLALSHAIGTKDIRLLRDTYYNNDAARSAALLPQQLALPKKNPTVVGRIPHHGEIR